jgi:hypothetical protein
MGQTIPQMPHWSLVSMSMLGIARPPHKKNNHYPIALVPMMLVRQSMAD